MNTSTDTMPVPQTAAEAIAQCREQGLAEPEKVARKSWPELFAVDDGGPAFGYGDHTHGGSSGMSLRDWFAGEVLAGICAFHGTYGENNGPDNLATRAYEVADFMLAARKTGGAA